MRSPFLGKAFFFGAHWIVKARWAIGWTAMGPRKKATSADRSAIFPFPRVSKSWARPFFAQIGLFFDGIFGNLRGRPVAGQFATNIYPFVQAALTLWLLFFMRLAMLAAGSRVNRSPWVAWRLIKTTLIVQLVVKLAVFISGSSTAWPMIFRRTRLRCFQTSQAMQNAASPWAVLDGRLESDGCPAEADLAASRHYRPRLRRRRRVPSYRGRDFHVRCGWSIVIISKVVTAFFWSVSAQFSYSRLLFKPTHRFF